MHRYDFLRDVKRPYWSLPLTLATNNLDNSAFRIIPRWATEIYFVSAGCMQLVQLLLLIQGVTAWCLQTLLGAEDIMYHPGMCLLTLLPPLAAAAAAVCQ
jgi:hypothetical protein